MNQTTDDKTKAFEERVNEIFTSLETLPVEQMDEYHTSIERFGKIVLFKQINHDKVHHLIIPVITNDLDEQIAVDMQHSIYEKVYLNDRKKEMKSLPFKSIINSAYPRHKDFINSCMLSMDEAISQQINTDHQKVKVLKKSL